MAGKHWLINTFKFMKFFRKTDMDKLWNGSLSIIMNASLWEFSHVYILIDVNYELNQNVLMFVGNLLQFLKVDLVFRNDRPKACYLSCKTKPINYEKCVLLESQTNIHRLERTHNFTQVRNSWFFTDLFTSTFESSFLTSLTMMT